MRLGVVVAWAIAVKRAVVTVSWWWTLSRQSRMVVVSGQENDSDETHRDLPYRRHDRSCTVRLSKVSLIVMGSLWMVGGTDRCRLGRILAVIETWRWQSDLFRRPFAVARYCNLGREEHADACSTTRATRGSGYSSSSRRYNYHSCSCYCYCHYSSILCRVRLERCIGVRPFVN